MLFCYPTSSPFLNSERILIEKLKAGKPANKKTRFDIACNSYHDAPSFLDEIACTLAPLRI